VREIVDLLRERALVVPCRCNYKPAVDADGIDSVSPRQAGNACNARAALCCSACVSRHVLRPADRPDCEQIRSMSQR
jgi:hypothetical protein